MPKGEVKPFTGTEPNDPRLNMSDYLEAYRIGMYQEHELGTSAARIVHEIREEGYQQALQDTGKRRPTLRARRLRRKP